jgi:hypothetical protein
MAATFRPSRADPCAARLLVAVMRPGTQREKGDDVHARVETLLTILKWVTTTEAVDYNIPKQVRTNHRRPHPVLGNYARRTVQHTLSHSARV